MTETMRAKPLLTHGGAFSHRECWEASTLRLPHRPQAILEKGELLA